MVLASYAGPATAQEPIPKLEWRKTQIFVARNSGEAPSRILRDEWQSTLPHRPAARGVVWPWWHEGDERIDARRRQPSDEEALANARLLKNRLTAEGWLNAEVEVSWRSVRRGAMLELTMTPGSRWHIDSLIWRTQGSGLPGRRIEAISGLQLGMPLQRGKLQEAQDLISAYAQSLGYSTFHSGLVTFEADTLGRMGSQGVHLTVTCLPWDAQKATWMAGVAGDSSGLQPHPKVKIGAVTWNGTMPHTTSRPGELRSEVWEHLVGVTEGAVYNPQNLAATYSRLSGLSSVHRVSMTQSMRWDTAVAEIEVGLPGRAVMDLDFTLVPETSHDLGLELDMVRNDARYGPKLGATLLHRNPRGWGAENALEVAFGYVSVAPFSSFNRQTLFNSGEWTVRWSTRQLGIAPLSLKHFPPSTAPFTSADLGWDREVWPEFTRSQFHVQHDVGWTENPRRASVIRFSPANIAFVNLSNRDSSFVEWLDAQQNPLIQARFNNHLTLGSKAGWESNWRALGWDGHASIQASWAGGLAQTLAKRLAPASAFDASTGAWLVAPGVPLVQHQRILARLQARQPWSLRPNWSSAWNVLFGFANAGANTPSLPLEQAFFTGGANGVRGWRLRDLGPGNVNSLDTDLAILGVGDVRLDVQLELRHQLNPTWSAAWFTDAGNVWLHGKEAPEVATLRGQGVRSVGWSTGMGLRYNLDFFLMRLDAGIRLHDPTQPDQSRWFFQSEPRGALHLGLGLPF